MIKLNTLLQEKKFSEYKWQQMLNLVIPFYYSYEKMGMKLEEVKRVEDCGMYLMFNIYKDLEGNLVQKLVNANFCRDKFCQICNWRRSLKYQNMYYQVLSKLIKEKEYKILFLTLTIKDPSVNNLKETLKHLNYAFKKLSLSRKFKRIVKGYIRALEVHFKKENKKEVHPHFHLILLVNKSYFSKSKDNYIKYEEWRELWRKALNVDYYPQVSISSFDNFLKRIKNDKRKVKSDDELMLILKEVIKYPFKSNFNLKGVDIKDFKLFRDNLRNVRLIASGGVIKQKYRELFLTKSKIDFDEKNENLVYVGSNEVNGDLIGNVTYVWKQPGWHFLKDLKIVDKSQLNYVE